MRRFIQTTGVIGLGLFLTAFPVFAQIDLGTGPKAGKKGQSVSSTQNLEALGLFQKPTDLERLYKFATDALVIKGR